MINESSEIITDVISNLEDISNTDVVGNLEDVSNIDVDLFDAEQSVSPTVNIIDNSTQIQSYKASLTHVQTGIILELPTELSVIHIGKPNEKSPPDIDVSGFPHSQVVSRIHADIIVDGDTFFLEDTGSANGTYINHTPLPTGNRHRLKNGDRIALGKEDKVSFIFDAVI